MDLSQLLQDSIPEGEAICIGCGCHDSYACAEGCGWLVVNDSKRIGVCSNCATKQTMRRYKFMTQGTLSSER